MLDGAGIAPVFRDEWSKLVAILVRDLGDLDIAEDAAQDAFIEAAAKWPKQGKPTQPGAWLLTVARRKAIDRMRRTNRDTARLTQFETQAGESGQNAASEQDNADGHTSLVDDQLALLLGCCHPALNLDAQVALTLRAVAGLSTEQIARAFLVAEPSMVRRITRAKAKIRGAGIPFTIPGRDQLDQRVNSAAQVIYLIFNEGHTSTGSISLIRGDLCDEAIWLSGLLAHLVPDDPEVHGLAALISITDSRRHTRVDSSGRPILLEDQERATWDRVKIQTGLAHLGKAHDLGQLGPYQIQAAIQALHAAAPSFEETSWSRIVGLYDLLFLHQPSAVVALNRTVADSYVNGPEAALHSLEGLEEALDSYVYFHSTQAELLLRAGHDEQAKQSFGRAIDRSANEAERQHFERRREQC